MKKNREMKKNTELYVGIGILALILLLLIGAPWVSSGDYTSQNLQNVFAGSSWAHPLGTDNLGRDIWARLLYGGRVNLSIAAFAVLIPFVVGSLVGALAGYFGGWVDGVVMRIADIVSAFPFYVLIIALVFVLGSGAQSIIIAISTVSWVAYARIVRGETLVLRTKDFIGASTTAGFTPWATIRRHVLPNVLSQSVIYAMSDVVLNIGVIVTLSYFGLGITPPTPDWGQMMADGQQFFATGEYRMMIYPGIAAVITSMGLSLLGDGLASRMKVVR